METEVWKYTKVKYPDKIRIAAKIVVRLSGYGSTVDVKPTKTFLSFNYFLVRSHGLHTETARMFRGIRINTNVSAL